RSSRQFALDVADEQVMTTSQAFMALTVSCARCHDHKFDPVAQKDYYSMAGIFLSTKTRFGTLAGPRKFNESDLIELPVAAKVPNVHSDLAPDELAKLKKEYDAAKAALEELTGERGKGAPKGLGQEIQQALGRKEHLEAQVNTYDAAGHPKAFCMGV